jgi:hypothetical protein
MKSPVAILTLPAAALATGCVTSPQTQTRPRRVPVPEPISLLVIALNDLEFTGVLPGIPSLATIVLTETRSGTPTRAPGPAVVNAVRVMPASKAYPFATGTVSLGNLLVTAKTSIAAEALRPLLERMGEIQ